MRPPLWALALAALVALLPFAAAQYTTRTAVLEDGWEILSFQTSSQEHLLFAVVKTDDGALALVKPNGRNFRTGKARQIFSPPEDWTVVAATVLDWTADVAPIYLVEYTPARDPGAHALAVAFPDSLGAAPRVLSEDAGPHMAADLSGNMRADVLVAAANGTELTLWVNAGDANLTRRAFTLPAEQRAAGSRVAGLYLADLTLSCAPELVVLLEHDGASTVEVWSLHGAQPAARLACAEVGARVGELSFIDVFGSGRLDVVFPVLREGGADAVGLISDARAASHGRADLCAGSTFQPSVSLLDASSAVGFRTFLRAADHPAGARPLIAGVPLGPGEPSLLLAAFAAGSTALAGEFSLARGDAHTGDIRPLGGVDTECASVTVADVDGDGLPEAVLAPRTLASRARPKQYLLAAGSASGQAFAAAFAGEDAAARPFTHRCSPAAASSARAPLSPRCHVNLGAAAVLVEAAAGDGAGAGATFAGIIPNSVLTFSREDDAWAVDVHVSHAAGWVGAVVVAALLLAAVLLVSFSFWLRERKEDYAEARAFEEVW